MLVRTLGLILAACTSAAPSLIAQSAATVAPRAVQQQPHPADEHAAPVASTTLRVHGTISTYDPSKRLLSLKTEAGSVQFAVGANSRVRREGRKVEAQELKGLTGHRAAVRYSDSGGRKTVESVNVFE